MTLRSAAVASASLALMLSACGSGSDAPRNDAAGAEQPEAAIADPAEPGQPEPQKSDMAKLAPADGEVEARELTIEEISGGWRVTSVEGAKAGSENANMKGAIAEIYPESARWSYKPKGAGKLDGFCQEPVAGIVRTNPAQAASKKRFDVGGKKIAENAVAHELLCGGGGEFGKADGAGTDFALLSPDQMAMTWDDGTVLILEKMERPSPKEDMKPEDYRASDYDRE